MTMWTSDSSLIVKTPLGVAGLRAVGSTAALSLGTLSSAFFSPAAGPSPSSVVTMNMAATGASSVTLLGSGTGVSDNSARLRVGSSRFLATTWVSDSRVCGLRAHGTVAMRALGVTGSVAAGTLTQASTFDGPEASSVSASGAVWARRLGQRA
jgi:hypothetical protein